MNLRHLYLPSFGEQCVVIKNMTQLLRCGTFSSFLNVLLFPIHRIQGQRPGTKLVATILTLSSWPEFFQIDPPYWGVICETIFLNFLMQLLSIFYHTLRTFAHKKVLQNTRLGI